VALVFQQQQQRVHGHQMPSENKIINDERFLQDETDNGDFSFNDTTVNYDFNDTTTDNNITTTTVEDEICDNLKVIFYSRAPQTANHDGTTCELQNDDTIFSVKTVFDYCPSCNEAACGILSLRFNFDADILRNERMALSMAKKNGTTTSSVSGTINPFDNAHLFTEECTEYTSGRNAGEIVCATENITAGTCAFDVNGTMCNSCSYLNTTCPASKLTTRVFDCTNLLVPRDDRATMFNTCNQQLSFMNDTTDITTAALAKRDASSHWAAIDFGQCWNPDVATPPPPTTTAAATASPTDFGTFDIEINRDGMERSTSPDNNIPSTTSAALVSYCYYSSMIGLFLTVALGAMFL